MIKLAKDTIDRADINALCDWLSQEPIPQLTKGDLTIKYQDEFAKSIGVNYSVMVNSGSSANLLAIYLLKKKFGVKKIVIPALSWVTDLSPCIQLGLEPILCDCNFNDLSVDLEALETIFREQRPQALVLVSVLGLVPEMHQIIFLCKIYNVLLVEDFCESQGSKTWDISIGRFGIMGTCSNYMGHNSSCIEAGMITTNDEDIKDELLMMRSHGWTRDLSEEKKETYRLQSNKSKFEEQYTFHRDGFNFRSTDINAFLGLLQLKKFNSFIESRNKNFKKYAVGIKDTVLNLRIREEDFIANLGFPVVSKRRDAIVKALSLNNIECRPLISGNLARHPAFYEMFKGVSLPYADIVHKYGFYLPNHPFLTDDEIELIINTVNNAA